MFPSQAPCSLDNVDVTWIVKTIPTNPAVRRETPKDLGPTNLSCSAVFFTCTFPTMAPSLIGAYDFKAFKEVLEF